jgi:hypothetical protein
MPNIFQLKRYAAGLAVCLLADLLAGCAVAPDVTLTYYPARAESIVAVTQSVACDKDKNIVLLAHAVSIDTAYAADYGQPQVLQLAALGAAFAETEAAFKFSDDGRLKSINASTAGQGETVVKAASSLIALARSRTVLADAPNPCLAIGRLGGDKPLMLAYSRRLAHAGDDGDERGEARSLAPDPDSRRLFEQLRELAIGLPELTLRTTVSPVLPAATAGDTGHAERAPKRPSGAVLALKGTASVRIEVFADADPIGGADVTVPHGPTYYLPLPRPALFGKRDFSLTLSDAGAITAVSYSGDTGGASLVNAANLATQATAPPSTAGQASELKAQADLIRQQQRLSLCRLQPADCQ